MYLQSSVVCLLDLIDPLIYGMSDLSVGAAH